MKNPLFRAITILLAGLLLSGSVYGAPTTFKFKQLIDGNGQRLKAQFITVDAGVIVAINETPPRHWQDLSQWTVLPGLIDAHTHLTYALEEPAQGNAWQALASIKPEQRLALAGNNAIATLQVGITTVRDLNALDGVDLQLRQAIKSGRQIGPSIFTASQAIHPQVNNPPNATDITSPVYMEQTVRERIRAGADWIKIFATTGSADDLTSRLNYSEEAIAKAIRTAHALGTPVTIHSYGPQAVDIAIQAGANSIEHAVGMSETQLQMMRQKHISYVPTIDHNRYYASQAHEYGYNSDTQSQLHDFVEGNIKAVTQAHAAGVSIVFGSDAVMSGFGSNTCELLMLQRAGLSPANIIQTATINGAKLLRQDQHLGRLKVGYAADLVAIQGDPLEHIEHLVHNVQWVMKGGLVVADVRRENLTQPQCD